MDPKAALLSAIAAFLDGELADACESLSHYQQWRQHRGFEPFLTSADARVEEFSAVACNAIFNADTIARCLALELTTTLMKHNISVPASFGCVDLGFDFRSPSLLDHIADTV